MTAVAFSGTSYVVGIWVVVGRANTKEGVETRPSAFEVNRISSEDLVAGNNINKPAFEKLDNSNEGNDGSFSLSSFDFAGSVGFSVLREEDDHRQDLRWPEFIPIYNFISSVHQGQ